MATTLARAAIILLCVTLSACGYLDQDLLVDDEEFGESFDGLGLSGVGTSGWGCGGGGYSIRHGVYGRYAMRSPIPVVDRQTSAAAVLTDEQILDQTDIDVIDESAPVVAPNLVEELYYSRLQARNDSIGRAYGGSAD